MSHQRAGQIYLMGRGAKGQNALLCRTCHCRTYSYVCSCTAVLPLPGTPTAPEYKRRCRVTGWYTTGCPWLIPCLVTLFLQPLPCGVLLPPPSPTYLPPPSFDRPASLNFLSLPLPSAPLSLSFSLLRFVPHRRSRDQDVLQNKRLYLHARPSEKPPLVVEDDVNRRRELASFRPNALVAARNKVVYNSCMSIALWLKEFRKKTRCVNEPYEKSSLLRNHPSTIARLSF